MDRGGGRICDKTVDVYRWNRIHLLVFLVHHTERSVFDDEFRIFDISASIIYHRSRMITQLEDNICNPTYPKVLPDGVVTQVIG